MKGLILRGTWMSRHFSLDWEFKWSWDKPASLIAPLNHSDEQLHHSGRITESESLWQVIDSGRSTRPSLTDSESAEITHPLTTTTEFLYRTFKYSIFTPDPTASRTTKHTSNNFTPLKFVMFVLWGKMHHRSNWKTYSKHMKSKIKCDVLSACQMVLVLYTHRLVCVFLTAVILPSSGAQRWLCRLHHPPLHQSHTDSVKLKLPL